MTASKAKRRVLKRTARFNSAGQLLSELGERLVASPQVALAELVKNAYDADANRVNIWLDADGLHVADDGDGMSEDEFLKGWMVVATPSKLGRETSRRYGRALTGAKGVGRFASQLLGDELLLETTAKAGRTKSRITAVFPWSQFSATKPLDHMKIPYELRRNASADTGTTLTVRKLHQVWDDKGLRTVTGELLDIVQPPLAELVTARSEGDPGLTVIFGPPGTEEPTKGAASEVLERYVSRVLLEVKPNKVQMSYEYDGGKPRRFVIPLKANLVGPVTGEIRYFPRRKGVFTGMDTVDGRNARAWVKRNSGVRVIDRGFRMPPYGEPQDDWLGLSGSKARRDREWGSPLTAPLAGKRDMREAFDPLLKVPANHQLLGVLAVQSHRPRVRDDDERSRKLQPAMDRQGFVENDAYRQLVNIVRCAVELFAVIDVEETIRRKRLEAKRDARRLQRDLESAAERVRKNRSIPPKARREIVRSYEALGSRVADLDKASAEAQEATDLMSMLGVLSGFLTHETIEMRRAIRRMLGDWDGVPASQLTDQQRVALASAKDADRALERHLNYAKSFIGQAGVKDAKSFRVYPQVERVRALLLDFAEARGIKVLNSVRRDLVSPRIPVVVFSGIVLNLYTNAVKAVLAGGGDERIIAFEAESSADELLLRVSDTGIGIPDSMVERIFQPLVSTTRESALGPGLGLGLHVVRRLLSKAGGRIDVVPAPDGYRTCFETRFKSVGKG